MYQYGLGQSNGGSLPHDDPWSPTAPAPTEVIIVEKPRFDWKSPLGLGSLGVLGGYLAGKGKRAKVRFALVGGLVGAAASYFMNK